MGSPARSRARNFSLGVEEEYQIVDPQTFELTQRAEPVLSNAAFSGGEIHPELNLSQVEISTAVCDTLGEVRAELVRSRKELRVAAEVAGVQIAAAGTHPFSHWSDQNVTPTTRYLAMERDYAQLVREHIVFGFHVHVGIGDAEVALKTMERTAVWLPPLIALAANSPFWLGRDTGFASYRTDMCDRWPTGGLPESFGSRADYEQLVGSLISTGSIKDEAEIYWDVRPSARWDTLEFRVTDVCSSIDEAVMVTGLIRASAQICHDQVLSGAPPDLPRPELARAAKWRAARFGINDTLIDLHETTAGPAAEVIENHLIRLRPYLEANDDWEEIADLVHATLRDGTGADRQRRAFERTGRLEGVVEAVIRETLSE
ncbi:MAG: glutamate--cysteine ligase [Actinomycetota bacterium]|nr:glutamate--cysteine ligase [Actinomycetota bacterium]